MNQRQIGGQNFKSGSRYEDCFVTFKLVHLAAKHSAGAKRVRLKEQANCPVDDLMIEELDVEQFYQLKSGSNTTWGADNGKLKKEFLDQYNDCKKRRVKFRLVIVVSDASRKKSFEKGIPHEIKPVTSVVEFPLLKRPSELVDQKLGIKGCLKDLSASRFESRAAHEIMIESFYYAWIDHAPDADGFCILADVLTGIQTKNLFPLCHPWQDNTGKWEKVREILSGIAGLEFWTDRGYFEWLYLPFDQGIRLEPCESSDFARFMDRILAINPQTFGDFEAQL